MRTTAAGTPVFAPSGAPVWNSPTLDLKRGLLYVGSGENYASPANESSDAVIAFRLSDGQRMWVQQLTRGDAWNVACMMQANPNCPAENGPDVDVAASVIPYTDPSGASLLLVGQKNGWVYALDPDADGQDPVEGAHRARRHPGGSALWHGARGRLTVRADRRPGRRPRRAQVRFARRSPACMRWMPGPDMRCGRCRRLQDCSGRKFCDIGISAPLTAIPGVVFAGHMDGMLRAYDCSHRQGCLGVRRQCDRADGLGRHGARGLVRRRRSCGA